MGVHTFRKHEKIRKRKEFTEIYSKGKRYYSGNFTVIVYKRNSGCRRLGITVSKKVGNAVRRNRIKRLIREFFRLNRTLLTESQDVVVMGKKNIPRLNYHDVCRELECLMTNKANE